MNTTLDGFAIIPDGSAHPAALFEQLEDAMDWGLRTYGGDAFRIRFLRLLPVESADANVA